MYSSLQLDELRICNEALNYNRLYNKEINPNIDVLPTYLSLPTINLLLYNFFSHRIIVVTAFQIYSLSGASHKQIICNKDTHMFA